MPHYIDSPRGMRKHSPIITVAAAATPEILYQLTQGGQNPRTCIVRKIMCYSNVGNIAVDIGIGLAAAFANIIPTIYVINLFDAEWMEDEIIEVEVNQDIIVQADILGVMVQVEVEEIGE